MTVSVVIPWAVADCPHRQRALEWVLARYAEVHPGWQVVLGDDPEAATTGLFSRTTAITRGVAAADGDVLVVIDGDVWCPLDTAVRVVATAGAPWVVPHGLIHRLNAEATELVLDGFRWSPGSLPLSGDNEQDAQPYRGHPGGTALVLGREAWEAAPCDVRFRGWGSEDRAWTLALRTLVGEEWRGHAHLLHLWHPPQPRLSRVTGTKANDELRRLYERAARRPEAMAELVAAGRP